MRIKCASLYVLLPDVAAYDNIPLFLEAVWNFLQALWRAVAVLQASDVCQRAISHFQSTESKQYSFSQVGWSYCCTQSREVASLSEARLYFGEDGWVYGMNIDWDVGIELCGWKDLSAKQGAWRGGYSESRGFSSEVMEFLRALLWIQRSAGSHHAASVSHLHSQNRGARNWGTALEPARSVSSHSAASQLNKFLFFPAAGCVPQGFVN